MCRARKSGRRDAKRMKKMIALVRADLLRYHEATAKLNAAVRRAFPREHRVAKVMEMCSSGTINDAPGEIQSFVGAIEDACYCHAPEEAQSITDDIGRRIDEARAWAGRPPLTIYGEFLYPRRVSWLERSLVSETRAAAEAFFRSAYALPGVEKAALVVEEARFLRRHEILTQALSNASYDPYPRRRLLLVLMRRVPSEVSCVIASFVADCPSP